MPIRKNSKRNKYIFAAVFFIALIAYIIIYKTENPSIAESSDMGTRFEATDVKVEYNYDSKASFYSYGSKDFFFCTKDGVQYILSNGDTKWVYTYSMAAAPIMIGEGEYIAVVETKGSKIYVFSPEGLLYEETLPHPIMYFSMNPLGYTTVILNEDDHYSVYTFSSEKSVWGWKHGQDNIFPICGDVSNDGRIVALGNLSIQGIQKNSNIIFGLAAEGKNEYTDSIFGALNDHLENQIAMSVKFMEENRLIIFSDSRMNHVSIDEKNNILSGDPIELNNRIDFIAQIGDKRFVTAMGEGMVNREATPVGRLIFYDTLCNEVGVYDTGGKVTYLTAGKQGVIAGNQHTYTAFNENGVFLWEYTATQDIKQILFLENTDTVLVASETEAMVMKRTRK